MSDSTAPAEVMGIDPLYHEVKTPPRLTVVEMVYHQPPDAEGKCEDLRYCRSLLSEDEPYSRTMRLTTSWCPLDVGWVRGGCSALILINESPAPEVTPGGRRITSSPEHGVESCLLPQRSSRPGEGVVEVSLRQLISYVDGKEEVLWRLLPGESCRLPFSRPECLRLRASSSGVKCRIMLVPE